MSRPIIRLTRLTLAALLWFCPAAPAAEARMQGDRYSTIGYAEADGRVQDDHYSTLGSLGAADPARVAVFYFFFATMRTQS